MLPKEALLFSVLLRGTGPGPRYNSAFPPLLMEYISRRQRQSDLQSQPLREMVPTAFDRPPPSLPPSAVDQPSDDDAECGPEAKKVKLS